jgi:hypothetical protein
MSDGHESKLYLIRASPPWRRTVLWYENAILKNCGSYRTFADKSFIFASPTYQLCQYFQQNLFVVEITRFVDCWNVAIRVMDDIMVALSQEAVGLFVLSFDTNTGTDAVWVLNKRSRLNFPGKVEHSEM